MTDEELRAQFAKINQRLDHLATLQEETTVELGSVTTRLGSVERVLNRVASEVGVESLPALGSSGRAQTSLAAKGSA